MMISPEEFYNESLKGKSTDQIMRVIRSLKREIGRLKNIVEHPDYSPTMCPTESTQIFCSKLYLEKAKLALLEIGETYTPTKAEQRAMAFDDNIPNISKVFFTIGGFFGGREERFYEVRENKIHAEYEHNLIFKTDDNIPADEIKDIDKGEFLEQLKNLHIGEWRRNYDTLRFGYEVCDGAQWELHIYFSNGHKPVKIYGDNAYPYNFDSVLELFEIEK